MRAAINNSALALMFGIPFIVISFLIPSTFSSKLLGAGIFVVIVGIAMALYLLRNGSKEADRLFLDEREELLTLKAMRFTFLIIGFFINTFWAHYISLHGNEQFDYLFWLLVIFWASYLSAFIYIRFKA